MSVELFDIAVREGRPVCYYLFRDLGIGKDCKYFVETGTHLGGSVQFALDLGFEEALSCEMMPDRYNHCMEKFSENDNVSLWLGDSDDGGGVPTFEELDLIAENEIKDHTIIIDDIPVYFLGRQKQLEDKLKSINPNYTLTYYKSIDREQDYVLAAYVE
jgi:hypothetical protein